MTDFSAPAEIPTPPRAGWRAGLAVAARLSTAVAIVALLAQVGSVGLKAYYERQSADSIQTMRAEQSWLVSENLAPATPIGVFATSIYAYPAVRPPGASTTATSEIMGFEAGSLVRMADDLLAKPILGKSALNHEWAIVAPEPVEPPASPDGIVNRFSSDIEFVYRHEEGHARAYRQGLSAKAPEAWPAAVGSIFADRLNERQRLNSTPGTRPSATDNWRVEWLGTLRGEAFADAFGCLSVARRGQEAMDSCALRAHAVRSLPIERSSTPSSLMVAGASHSVDMASFIAGQFKASDVSRLDAAGLDELAGRVADASVAWAVARQAQSIGFFSPEGQRWWTEFSARAGLAPAQAQSAWKEWSADALSEQPRAAFGSFEWTVQGRPFRSAGLPSTGAQGQWRYDGYGGTIVWAGGFEVGDGGPLGAGRVELVLASTGKHSRKIERHASARGDVAHKNAASEGAFWTHWTLARRMGVDLDQEAKRVEAILLADEPRAAASRFAHFTQAEAGLASAAESFGAKLRAKRRSAKATAAPQSPSPGSPS